MIEPSRRLLVFSKTAGYRHESIPAGIAAVCELAATAGLEAEATEDAAVFTSERLRQHAAIVFLCTSGEIFDERQRAALRSYVYAGGGFVGVHSASDTEYSWPFYVELVGARFDRHPPVQQAAMNVEDAEHPATAHLGARWTHTDEWYDFRSDPRARGVRVLLTVDESTYEGGGMGAGHPIAWCHEVGAGRCFYTALGHTVEAYGDPAFRAHLAGGIRSVL